MPAKAGSFGTFLIIGPTCFFLGILFTLLPYDYPILWAPASHIPKLSTNPFDAHEFHLRTLHASPPLIGRILNLVIGTGLLGFIIKLYKPSESNMLFDGGSLVLYLAAVIIYLTNIVRGLRAASADAFVAGSPPEASRKLLGLTADEELLSREESLRVLAASNTILALVLVGVLVLQAGQWYAQRKEEVELEEMRRKAAADREKTNSKKRS